MTQIIDALASISNLSGDRHGLAGGERISDTALASMAVHSAGNVSLFLARVHRQLTRTKGR
jgi:hypothetical protein